MYGVSTYIWLVSSVNVGKLYPFLWILWFFVMASEKSDHIIRPPKTTPSIHPHHFCTSIPPPCCMSQFQFRCDPNFWASRFRSNGRQPVFGAAVSGLGRPWVRAPARVSAWQCKTPPMRCYNKMASPKKTMAPTPMNLYK